MTLFSILLGAVLVSLIAVSMLVMPALVRPTLPLGVSVPRSRVDEPVVRAAVRRYRVIVVVGWVAAIVVLVAVAPVEPSIALLASVLLFLVVSVVAYLVPRTAIQRAKRDQGWYDDVAVRIVADSAPAEVPRPPTGWFAVSLALLGVVSAIGIAGYDRVPDPLPVHWNAAGVADAYAEKSIWSVFGPLLIGGATVVGLYALSFLVRISPVRGLAADDRATNAARAFAVRSLTCSMLGRLMLGITAIFAWTSLLSWSDDVSPAVAAGGTIALVVVLLLVIVIFLWRYARAVRGAGAGGSTGDANAAAADAPDDDRHWKAGMVYVNADDPSFMVQKRFGVGWTVNLGHPAGVIAVVVLLALVVAALVVPLALA
ncbi:DUF5808 domain-containing protein [Agromyces endophyticus]|uniref:DUF5808 domain-containing protein n=1 Tax=Agromyces sp. H17E-10 TaxID=2932244 RepID=UPI001FD1FC26|nr:DUF5808 domain-containing protein [Agromyces sp. H17E-10]UOQ88529.1 DUF5808 domain-containing protein [Agromyces sp. H17E-10]